MCGSMVSHDIHASRLINHNHGFIAYRHFTAGDGSKMDDHSGGRFLDFGDFNFPTSISSLDPAGVAHLSAAVNVKSGLWNKKFNF
ncbi:MAG: hypothetical protein ACD_34C00312G0002 [uncultured bacterium]|nr:MAG: hypothetical protein ACD_34C00312G0002 [uncultured bacterium]